VKTVLKAMGWNRRTTSRWWLSFLLITVLFGSLAPAWAQVVVRATAGDAAAWSYVEICTADGLKRIVKQTDNQENTHPVSGIDTAHCGYCLTQQQFPGPIAIVLPLDVPLAQRDAPWQSVHEQSIAVHPWRRPPSRAPPCTP